MNERLRPNQNNNEQLEGYEIGKSEQHPSESNTESHKSSEKQKPSVESIAKKVEEHSTTGEKLGERFKESRHEHRRENQYQNPSPTLKKQARKQALRDIRRQLPRPSRAFSRVINQPAVDAVSEVASNTIARPSSLLAGGMFSLIANIGVLLAAKYYGYEYNFLIGIVSFVGGFAAGLAIEGLARLLYKARD